MEDLKLEDDISSDLVPLAFGVGPLPRTLFERSLGSGRSIPGPRNSCRLLDDEKVAEERLIARKKFDITSCKLASQNQPQPILGHVPGHFGHQPASTRSTFLMVFSPDKEFIASTHGDHNVYVSKVKNGECVKVLKGHPRTPWCVAFHPSRDGLLASGCLGGHIRVWDLHGGSEVWKTDGVIASLAFHPTDHVLAIATFNELHFWDWNQREPFASVVTKNEKEKVRYVKFDSLGHQLITGIANMGHPHQLQPPASSASRVSPSNSPSPQEERRGRIMDRYARIIQQYNNLNDDSIRIRRLGLPRRAGGTSLNDEESVLPRTGGSPSLNSVRNMSQATQTGITTSSTPASSQSTRSLNSASQTLSDLAQAASNQLMAENDQSGQAESLAATTRRRSPLVVNMSSSRESSVERDDPFLSDHPYGASSSSSRVSYMRLRTPDWSPSTSPPRPDAATVSERLNRSRDRSDIDHAYYRRELRDRMLVLSREREQLRRQLHESAYQDYQTLFLSQDQQDESRPRTPTSFSHSPESEFVEVTRLNAPAGGAATTRRVLNSSTEYYRNPERTPSGYANIRFRSIRERRLRELLDRRQTLVSQIEHLRSARELLFPATTSVPPSRSSSSSSQTAVAAAAVTTPAALPISDDAVNGDHTYGVRPIDEWAVNRRLSLESHQLAENMAMDLSERGEPNGVALRNRSIRMRQLGTTPTVIRSDSEVNPTVVNERDAEVAASSVVEDPEAETGSVVTSANDRNRENLDILGRHIDHMQRICRASLSDMASSRQRRQVLRLQSIRRMLSELQQQIRSLRQASMEEWRRRSREADELSSALGNVTGLSSMTTDPAAVPGANSLPGIRTGENRNSSPPSTLALTRQRASAALLRLRRASGRYATLTRSSTISQRGTARAARPSTTSLNSANPGPTRARLARSHSQLQSQLRVTFNALDGNRRSRKTKAKAAKSKAEVSQMVMEQIEENTNSRTGSTTEPIPGPSRASTTTPGSTASSTPRNELRAISQRLERMVQDRTGVEDAPPRPVEQDPLTDDLNIPAPNPNVDFTHLLEGTLQYDNLTARATSSRRPTSSDFGQPRMMEVYSSSGGESENDDGIESFFGSPAATTPSRNVSVGGRWTRYDFPSQTIPDPIGTPRRHPRTRDHWRASIGDARASLDRQLRRLSRDRSERRRINRDMEISARRRRYERYMAGDLDVLAFPARTRGLGRSFSTSSSFVDFDQDSNDLGLENSADRLPPLREIIWRRLRRRNAQLNLLDDEIGAETGRPPYLPTERSRHREMLSWMVDQLTIDQQHNSPGSASSSATTSSDLQRPALSSVTSAITTARPPNASSTVTSTSSTSAAGGNSEEETGVSEPSAPQPPPPPPPSRGIANQQQLPPQHRYLLLRDPEINMMPSFQHRDNILLQHSPTNLLLTHRIQAWDFSLGKIPDIKDPNKNVVVREAKIHNDASVDISDDGTLLVTLVPSNLPMTTVVGVYALSTANRGLCYATFNLESAAVSVSLSPTTRHLLVGLAVRSSRLMTPNGDRGTMAQIFRLKMPWEWNGDRGRLVHRRDIQQSEPCPTALNCIRWIPLAGQGIVYATNTGLLKILR